MSVRPIKGAYVARLDLNQPHLAGVAEKVRAQIAVLSNGLGGTVDLLYPSGGDLVINGRVVRHFGSGKLWRRVVHYFLFYLAVPRLLGRLDFIYLRYQGSSLLLTWMLGRLQSKNPDLLILMEVPTYPLDQEEASLKQRIASIAERSIRKLLRKYVVRIVTFSRQDRIFGIETIRIDNGVDAKRFRVSGSKESADELRLVGLANLSIWHGYDRVIEGIARHLASYAKPNVVFDIVGAGKELQNLIAVTHRLGVQKNVIFHGPVRGDDLDEIVNRCHIAVGCIGMHRVHADTSDLKSREFCARGLPFLTGYDDKDFDEHFKFAMRVPSSDAPVEIASAVSFYEGLLASCPDFPFRMHRYAERQLDWETKFAPVLGFLKHAIKAN